MTKPVSDGSENSTGVHSGVTPVVSDPEPMPLFGKAWDEWHGRMLARADVLHMARNEGEIPERHGYGIKRRVRTHEQIEGDMGRFV